MSGGGEGDLTSPAAPARRQSIAAAVTVEGAGLHYGRPCRLTFRPALSGAGVVFRRVDLSEQPTIPATVEHAVLSERRTQLGEGERSLHTVEHVLAAVAGLGVDDLVIEMDAPEPPILDGSAAPFLEALQRAGLAERAGAVQYLELAAPVRVSDGEATYEATPARSLQLDVTIEFPHPAIGRQRGEFEVTRESFARELARARTFGFVHEVEALRAKGLIRGASTSNAVVLDERGPVETTLRWPDEFLRHKALDCVGDLALAGKRVRARVVATRPSHRGTVLLVREMTRQARQAATTTAARAPVSERVSESARDGGTGGGTGGPPKPARTFDIDEIMKVLPHRYPFLLVDRIIDLEPGKRVVGIKNVTINEPFFQGHFPGHPIMPGVLIIEAMAQVGGMLLLGAFGDPQSKVVYFMSLDNVKWRRPVKPGDQLRFEVEVIQIRGRICKMRGLGYVDGEVAAEADMAAMVRDR